MIQSVEYVCGVRSANVHDFEKIDMPDEKSE